MQHTNPEWPTTWTESQGQLATEHQSWLQHNTTQGLRIALDKLTTRITDFIAAESTSKDTPDNIVRLYAAQLKQLNTIKKIIYDTSTFVNELSK